jgi:DNA mismatch endonuclease (patch repair protein)
MVAFGTVPGSRQRAKTNEEYRTPKLRSNRERDLRNTKDLVEAGWRVLRVWEHQTGEESLRQVLEMLSD